MSQQILQYKVAGSAIHEHYDECLDNWANTSKQKILLDMSIFSPGAIKGFNAKDIMRNLDPANLNLIFQGQTYDLIAAENAINGILTEAIRFLATQGQTK